MPRIEPRSFATSVRRRLVPAGPTDVRRYARPDLGRHEAAAQAFATDVAPRSHALLAKRVLDPRLLVPAALVALPPVAIPALCAAAVSPRNPFHARCSRKVHQGWTIRVRQVRTMHRDKEARLARHVADDPVARCQRSPHVKLLADPRILAGIGTFLRCSSIDELPQLDNTLHGDMSFVGPKPFPEC